MATFRTNQNNANTHKLNTLLSTVIVIFILNLSLQIWLLYTALNYALDDNAKIATIAFIGSLVIFLICVGFLYYLPSGKPTKEVK